MSTGYVGRACLPRQSFLAITQAHAREPTAHAVSLHGMRIGLNMVFLVPDETGGTETYARELIPRLLDARPDIEFIAFVNRETASRSGAWSEALRVITVPVHARNRTEWVRGEQRDLPRLAAREVVDLVHSLANTGPLWGSFKRVLTVHDLHHRTVPDAHLGILAHGMRIAVSTAVRRSDRVIVPAEATAVDVQRHLGVARDRIDVIPEGIGAEQRATPLPEPEIRGWLNAGDRPLVLSVSAKRPHKNLVRLISAIAAMPPDRRPMLVIPGYPTPYEQELRRHVATLGVQDDIRLLGWIEPSKLEGLYAAAECLVCASLHEGFGLPVLEAMARGLPVACSTGGALSEVAGGAALLFDPHSVPQITAAIERLLADRDERNRLRAAGLSRASGFTWAATATRTLASYEAAMGTRP